MKKCLPKLRLKLKARFYFCPLHRKKYSSYAIRWFWSKIEIKLIKNNGAKSGSSKPNLKFKIY